MPQRLLQDLRNGALKPTCHNLSALGAADSSTFDRRDDSLAAIPHQSRLQVRWIDRKDLGVPIAVELDECGDASISEDRHAIERLLVGVHEIWARRLGAVDPAKDKWVPERHGL